MKTDDETSDATTQRLTRNIAWWTQQAEQIEIDRTNINKWVPSVGIPVAIGASFIHLLLGSAVAAAGLLAWLLGIYMTAVRRAEFQGNRRAAEDELRAYRGEDAT